MRFIKISSSNKNKFKVVPLGTQGIEKPLDRYGLQYKACLNDRLK